MRIGFVGLGRMGGNMTERLIEGGHAVTVYDRDHEAINAAVKKGAVAAPSLQALAADLTPPRTVWVMVPAGSITAEVIASLSAHLEAGDVVIDGGNSNYHDSMRQAAELRKKGIQMLDAGTSGGIWGLKEGYCIMVGGEASAFKKAEPLFKTLAPEQGYAHVGPNGAGHFVKMVHNGIEYAMLEAYGEGFELLSSKKEFKLDLLQIAKLWNRGSVVRSWLLELCVLAFEKDPSLEKVRGYVDDTGEGRWTVQEAIDQSIPAPAITLALLRRFASRQEESFSAKVIAALRNEFGGHAVKREEKK